MERVFSALEPQAESIYCSSLSSFRATSGLACCGAVSHFGSITSISIPHQDSFLVLLALWKTYVWSALAWWRQCIWAGLFPLTCLSWQNGRRRTHTASNLPSAMALYNRFPDQCKSFDVFAKSNTILIRSGEGDVETYLTLTPCTDAGEHGEDWPKIFLPVTFFVLFSSWWSLWSRIPAPPHQCCL